VKIFTVEGRGIQIQVPLDMNSVSSKARRILQVVREIPYGEVRSYRWVALKLKNRGYRAVGRIMSINPFPIIVPCHRVIYADGTLGGFSGGISLKKRLLEIEGIHILPLISKVV